MKVFNPAERAARHAARLFRLRLAPARDDSAGANLHPVVVSLLPTLKILFRRQGAFLSFLLRFWLRRFLRGIFRFGGATRNVSEGVSIEWIDYLLSLSEREAVVIALDLFNYYFRK
jgi:hypothetical protein